MRKFLISTLLLLTIHLSYAQTTIERFLYLSDSLVAEGGLEQALIMLDQAERQDAKNPEVDYKRAGIYLTKNKKEEAIALFEKSLTKDPLFSPSYEQLANIYIGEEKNAEAILVYEKALNNFSDPAEKLLFQLQIIELYISEARLQEAFAHVKEVKAIMGESFDINYYEARYYNHMGDYDLAEEKMLAIINEIDPSPGNEKFFYELAFAQLHLGKYNEMKQYLKVANTPEFAYNLEMFRPEYYFNMANAYFTIMDYEACEESINKCLGINPKFTQAYELKKKLLGIRANKSTVIEVKTKQLETISEPQRKTAALMDLALMNYKAKEYEMALMHINELLSIPINIRNVKAYYLKAICEFKYSDEEMGEAYDILTKLIYNPKTPAIQKTRFALIVGRTLNKGKYFKESAEFLRMANIGEFKEIAAYEYEEMLKHKAIVEFESMKK
ncbi:tetratricopeptide repeat protein [Sediminitomix flava]|uniref:Tetratricopeptide repeat protein n=1 Tax=Sediminitomix flava TaxID=379075 RepID=A0A315ZC26_SEDFL|nr:tetratricopeptide repeat protein [Sediminitomix flava]PWJ42284.1 tetratricopeptide repeat protein [Sediminitomix flava]